MSVMKSVVATAVALLGSALIAGHSLAAPIDQSSTTYLGYYAPPEPASEAAEIVYVNNLLDVALSMTFTDTLDGDRFYSRSSNICGGLACLDATNAFKDDTKPSTTISVGDWTYLIGKYDGPGGGSLVWYVGGLEEVTIPEKWGPADKTFGLSHWTVFSTGDGPPPPPPPQQIPEPGTLALVGLALFGAAAMRRRQRSK